MARVFVFRWTPGHGAAERRCRALWNCLEPERQWTKFVDRRGVLGFFAVDRADLAPVLLAHGRGALFGPVFAAGAPGAAHLTQLDEAQSAELVQGGGKLLTTRYWGAYFAVLHDRARDVLKVVREPTGGGAVFIGPLGEATAIFSHASDYLALAQDPAPDVQFLSAFIAHSRMVAPRTAIEGVREVMAGEEASFPRRLDAMQTQVVWRPASRAAPFGPEDFETAAARLRETLLACARSWAQAPPTIVHRLSGGLDSSIALAALARAGAAEIIALNEYAPAVSEGDERPYARAAAAACGVRLLEVEMSPERVDYARLLTCELGAKPSRAEMSATDPTVAQAIAAVDPCALVTSGQGGDQVFHRSRLPIIAADAWRDGQSLRSVAEIALNTARLARRPVWDVFAAILRHGVLRQPYRPGGPLRSMRLLDGGRGAAIAEEIAASHPWTEDMGRAPPARALRIAHLMDLQYYHQRYGLSSAFLSAPVLASQPVVELCLRIPPYVMTWGGRERALVRAACHDLAPETVLKRTGKGDTTRYHTAVLQRQLPFMRDMLIGGELERAGIVASASLHAALSKDVVPKASITVALSSALLAEIWLRRFRALCAAARASRREAEAPQGGGAEAAVAAAEGSGGSRI